MDLINCFRRLWHARQLPVSAAESPVKAEGIDRMLQGLQQLCATLPQGEAEVWLRNGQINMALHWNPEVKTQGNAGIIMPENAGEKSQGNARQTVGLYFLLNGRNNEVQYAEYEEKNTDDSPQISEKQVHNREESQVNSPVLSDEGALKTAEKSIALTEEKPEKPSRQLKALKQLLNFLQLHYVFRYNRLTDRSGSRRFICVEVSRPIDCTTPIEYDQLYAQLKYELLHGERSWFSKEEEAEIQQGNEAFYRVTPAEELLGDAFQLCEPHDEGAHLLSAAQIYTSLKSQHPAALQDCTPLAFSKLLAQVGKRVHTKNGNGYWVKVAHLNTKI